jgi:hypothetical protein
LLLEADLAAAEGQVECWLLNAAHLHNVPGRKTDVADAAWIAQLDSARAGPPQLRAAPPSPRAARADPLPQAADPGAQPGGPAAGSRSWEDAGPELSSVATDIIGVSGRAMLEALVAGTHDPELLAALAKSSAPDQAASAAGGPGRPLPHRPSRAAGRPDPGPRRLPGPDHRGALGADPAADRPVRGAGWRLLERGRQGSQPDQGHLPERPAVTACGVAAARARPPWPSPIRSW